MIKNLSFQIMLEVSGSLRTLVGPSAYAKPSDLDKSRIRNFCCLWFGRQSEGPKRERDLSKSLFCF
jgi:hypothetical protein